MLVDTPVDARALCKLLGEPARWRIVERLAAEELCVCHLVEDLDLGQSLISHHLKVLRAGGVVTSERYRQWTYYRLRPEVLEALAEQFKAVSDAAPQASRRPCC